MSSFEYRPGHIDFSVGFGVKSSSEVLEAEKAVEAAAQLALPLQELMTEDVGACSWKKH